jgi:hypothetical protein
VDPTCPRPSLSQYVYVICCPNLVQNKWLTYVFASL